MACSVPKLRSQHMTGQDLSACRTVFDFGGVELA